MLQNSVVIVSFIILFHIFIAVKFNKNLFPESIEIPCFLEKGVDVIGHFRFIHALEFFRGFVKDEDRCALPETADTPDLENAGVSLQKGFFHFFQILFLR